eukprot:TRINITY_DN3081_c0_g1_i2.p1 TRINITY_DN3081_c0_g1~~TRINITY_DN3081_c0_g1_i2.p1  ORF type:complete len:372 (+),score=89.79 TRINITY_DN3081_c0_g1_i2:92-1207(+)
MKALILVGGYGTRLRPLTLSTPKPCVPFCNKAMVVHQIEALKKVGVTTVVLAVSYKPDEMARILKPVEEELGVKLVYSHEKEPMGTAGPIALAKEILLSGDDANEPFFVLNSDITSEFPFGDLLEFHRSHGREGTIMVTTVSEPSKYGVVVYDNKTGIIDRFVEKPQVYVGNKINAGIYLFNTSILNRIELRPTSIEKEIFPQMASEGQLTAFELKGFWMDVGQPKDFISGMLKYLAHIQGKEDPEKLLCQSWEADPTVKLIQPVMIHPSATIGPNAVIGPFVTIGPDCTIHEGVRLKRCSLMQGVTVRAHSWVDSSILGWSSSVGRWVRMENFSVLGRDVQIKDELWVNGGKVLDHKEVGESITEPSIIM